MYYVQNKNMLVELTVKQADVATAKGAALQRYSVDRAHAWVKSGRTHSTALWVDEGKIRRAG